MSERRAMNPRPSGGARSRPWWRSRWWMPAVALTLGLVVFAAFAVGDNPSDGAKAFAVLAVVALVFAVATGSETLQGLGGPGRDERWAMIDLRASALAGLVTATAIVVCWLWEIAHGRDGSPYGQLAALGGLAYVLAVSLLRWRG